LQIFLPLRGIAICAVVAAHSAIGLLAAHLNADPANSLTPLLVGAWRLAAPAKFAILELCRFAVPLFVFLAGYHQARSPRTWRAIWNSSRKLLVPMLFWSLVAWGASWHKGAGGWAVGEFLRLLVSGQAQLGYFFVILVVQYFVLSRWLVPAVQRAPALAIAGAIVLQLLVHGIDYAGLLVRLHLLNAGGLVLRLSPFPEFLFPRFIVSFTLGIWASLHTDRFKEITGKSFLLLCALAAGAVLLLLVETGILFSRGYDVLRMSACTAGMVAWGEWKISTALWTIAAVFFITAAARRRLHLKKVFEACGKNSYEILLLHGMTLRVFMLAGHKFLAGLHWYGIPAFLLLWVAGVGLPMLAVGLVRRGAPRWVGQLLLGG
jgi:fucose 4-O-acetylase-like acetyltransferase